MQYLRKREGAALVEFALVALLFFALLFGIVEFGIIYFQHLSLTHAAREGSRVASLGRPTAQILSNIRTMASGMVDSAQVTVALEYSLDDGCTFPNVLGDNADGTRNNAPSGSLISVRLSYPHSLIVGGFFSFLPGVTDGGLPLRTQAVMQRE